MKVLTTVLLGMLAVGLAVPGLRGDDKKDGKEPDKISYYKDIRPIFAMHCQGCHQPAKAEGGYVMTNHKALLEKTDTDEPGVVPGQPDKSSVISMIISQDGQPPKMLTFDEDEYPATTTPGSNGHGSREPVQTPGLAYM